jgi:VIT1/CCC1 family predicted Fe2+/Mn2+ transporter
VADDDDRRFRANLRNEVDSASVYEALASAEDDPKTAEVYSRLASVERAHAEFWAKRLGDTKMSDVSPTARARVLAFLGKQFGPDFVLPTLASSETADTAQYDGQEDAVGGGFHGDVRSHARVVQRVAGRAGGLDGPTLAKLEGRHHGGGGNALRAAVLGANDGLVSNLSLVMGVAGAASQGRAILLTGLAGLVAGACSMAMGEWLSVNSAREMAQKQIDGERNELEEAPEMEKQELILIYRAKGLDEAAAKTLADKLFRSKDAALDTLVREELGVDPEGLGGSPWAAAAASFCLFALGAIVPVAAFFFAAGWTAVIISVGLSGVALIAIGGATSIFTGRSFLFSAGRQLIIGWAAALVTFGVGHLIGGSLH